ncbi:MAG: DNA repair protein RadC [Saprospiraceae bacterium]
MEEKLFKVKDWSPEDRPREKLLAKGIRSLSNAELLAILLGSGTVGMSVVDLAKKMLADHNHNINELSKTSVQELVKKYKGIGTAKAVTITAALELSNRQLSQTATAKEYIKSSLDAFNLLQPIIANLKHEEFWIIMLNRANKVIELKHISSGSQTGTVVDVKMIVRLALEHYATGIVLAHNHPSGTKKPSQEDKNITKMVKNAAELMQITVFDHVIVTESGYFSFMDEGIL